jgi:hypothetical protein
LELELRIVATACGTVHQNEMFLWEKQKNITLFKLEKKNFPNWRGNKINCNTKENNFSERKNIEAMERH